MIFRRALVVILQKKTLSFSTTLFCLLHNPSTRFQYVQSLNSMQVDVNSPETPVDYMEEDTVDVNDQDDLYTVSTLIDDLKHDDVQCRIHAIRKLPVIACALGEQRTRDELLPFLQGKILFARKSYAPIDRVDSY